MGFPATIPALPTSPEGFRSGFVALIGRPNVGKSTLLNQLVGEKVAITSPVAQTTRNRLRAILTTPSAQLVLLDPPFEANLWEPALKAAALALADPGYIYLEAPRAWDDDRLLDLGLQVQRQGKAGAVHFHLIGRRQSA